MAHPKKIRFISTNKEKINEFSTIFKTFGIEIIPVEYQIHEIQTQTPVDLIDDKIIKAFSKLRRPLIVEHTSLLISRMNGFPGGLTQCMWDSLKADRFCEIFGNCEDNAIIAQTDIAYIDGKKIHYSTGQISGTVAKKPQGDRTFQWDCVFIPEGYDKTFAELGNEKNKISMRKIAIDKLIEDCFR